VVRDEYHRLDRGSTASGSGHIQNDYIADPCSVASDRLHQCRILRLCIRCSVAVHKTLTAGTLSRNSKHGHGQTPCSIIKTNFGTCRSNVPRNRRFLVCKQIAPRFVNACGDRNRCGYVCLCKVRRRSRKPRPQRGRQAEQGGVSSLSS